MSVYGNLGCFHVLAIVNSAAMKIGVHVSFKLVFSFFSGYIPMSGITGSYGSSIFSFLKNFNYSFLQWVYHFTFLPTLYEGSLFSISLQTFVICRLFDDSHSDRCEMISHCGYPFPLLVHSCLGELNDFYCCRPQGSALLLISFQICLHLC